MQIGIDLDNTIILTDEFILKNINRYCGSSFIPKDLSVHSIEEATGLKKELVLTFVKVALTLTRFIKPFDGIPYYFNKISSRNKVYIISRRDPELYDVTKKALDKLGLRDYLLYLTLGKKSDVVKANSIKLMVEDNLEEIDDIYKNSNCGILLMSRYWNKEFIEYGNIKRVKSWEEIYATVTSIQARELGN
jgi:uncharacterized HAD superfamily protein